MVLPPHSQAGSEELLWMSLLEVGGISGGPRPTSCLEQVQLEEVVPTTRAEQEDGSLPQLC